MVERNDLTPEEQEWFDAGVDHFKFRKHDDPNTCANDLQTEASDLASGLVERSRDTERAADMVFEGMLAAEWEEGQP